MLHITIGVCKVLHEATQVADFKVGTLKLLVGSVIQSSASDRISRVSFHLYDPCGMMSYETTQVSDCKGGTHSVGSMILPVISTSQISSFSQHLNESCDMMIDDAAATNAQSYIRAGFSVHEAEATDYAMKLLSAKLFKAA